MARKRSQTIAGLGEDDTYQPEPVSAAEVQAGMPQFSQPPADSVYKPINMPVDRDVGIQDLPPGFAITEEGVRDPQGLPAKFRSPSVGQVLSKLGTDILPVAGGTLPALARGAIGAANGVDKLANGFTTGSGPIAHPSSGPVLAGTIAGLGGLAVLPGIAAPTPSDAEQALGNDHNDWVEQVRRAARNAPRRERDPEQKPVPAVLGIRG